MHGRPAIIYAHPRSEVRLQDPRDPIVQEQFSRIGQPDADPAPQHASADLPGQYEPVTAEEWAKLEAWEMLRLIGERYGYDRVTKWVRSLATIHGEEVR